MMLHLSNPQARRVQAASLNFNSLTNKFKLFAFCIVSQFTSFCLSEPQSGSDAFAMQTNAVKDGDHYVINGSKIWISNAAFARVFIVFVNADVTKVSE